MSIIHNTSPKGDSYRTRLHKREGMLDGNVLYIEYIGEIMEEVFGHNYRSTSVYGTFFDDRQFGEPYLMLPYGGEYSFCYSTSVNDMYFDYHRLKMETYEEIYQKIKSDNTVKDIWNDFEYTVQEMKKSLTDYKQALFDLGMEESMIDKLLTLFETTLHNKYLEFVNVYNVTTSLVETYTDTAKYKHLMIEIMVKAPKFFMVSEGYIIKNYRDIESFLEKI